MTGTDEEGRKGRRQGGRASRGAQPAAAAAAANQAAAQPRRGRKRSAAEAGDSGSVSASRRRRQEPGAASGPAPNKLSGKRHSEKRTGPAGSTVSWRPKPSKQVQERIMVRHPGERGTLCLALSCRQPRQLPWDSGDPGCMPHMLPASLVTRHLPWGTASLLAPDRAHMPARVRFPPHMQRALPGSGHRLFLIDRRQLRAPGLSPEGAAEEFHVLGATGNGGTLGWSGGPTGAWRFRGRGRKREAMLQNRRTLSRGMRAAGTMPPVTPCQAPRALSHCSTDGEPARLRFSRAPAAVYTVTVGRHPDCTCPDAHKGHVCKHYLFVQARAGLRAARPRFRGLPRR